MYIQRLKLTQYRNYPTLDLSFSPHINCLVGLNGSGKTNVLEAIHCLAITKSFRSAQDRWLVSEGETFFFIDGELQKEDRILSVQRTWSKEKGKKIIVDKAPLDRASEHIGSIPLVAILPSDTQLITGAAADRRKFLDALISQYSKTYLFHLIQYDKILQQRNALLKGFREMRIFDEEQLELWDRQLVPHGQEIARFRKEFIQNFQPIFSQYFDHIVAQGEVPKIVYKSHIGENTVEEWYTLFRERREKDQLNLYTTGGIHRDDLQFMLNGQTIKNFGSQGQQKTFAISLKLAQYFLLMDQRQMSPILLLDDIFDKLDQFRLKRIGELVEEVLEGQVFITDTSLERLKGVFSEIDPKRQVFFYRVEKGHIEQLNNEEA